MFAQRGVRTLPRLVDETGGRRRRHADALRLPEGARRHLRLAHLGDRRWGPTGATSNPTYEPFVEIFQGHRNSYEHLGRPAVARRPAEAIGGWRPLGMVWNALAMQYKFGFQASSDHISTHISYAVAIAEDAEPRGDPRRLQAAATATARPTTSCSTSAAATTSWATSSTPTARSRSRSWSTAPGRSRGSTSSRTSSTSISTEPNGAARRVRVDRRGAAAAGAELVLRPRPAGRRRARLGEPDLGPFRQRTRRRDPTRPTRRPCREPLST